MVEKKVWLVKGTVGGWMFSCGSLGGDKGTRNTPPYGSRGLIIEGKGGAKAVGQGISRMGGR